MKVAVLFGTRPEIIRLSETVKRMDAVCRPVLIHTGQNYDPALSDVFFKELGLRDPDYYLDVRADTVAEQIGQILSRSGDVLAKEMPDRLLILGDTNSALSAIVAARMGIPVIHMEAGNRCYDDRVPEEINRRIIDHSSSILLPYTHRSMENLVREGVRRERMFVVGNPIYEVLVAHQSSIDVSSALTGCGVDAGEYILATMHRAENVDDPVRLGMLIEGLHQVAENLALPVLVSTHPRTAHRLGERATSHSYDRVRWLAPLGLFDFLKLQRHAKCVLTDSGTVQEECCIFHIPNVTIRDVTERPETLECGSAILSGADPDSVTRCVDIALSSSPHWMAPEEYTRPNVSRTVVNIVTSYHLL